MNTRHLEASQKGFIQSFDFPKNSSNDECFFNDGVAEKYKGSGLVHYCSRVHDEGFKQEIWTFHASNAHWHDKEYSRSYYEHTGYISVVLNEQDKVCSLLQADEVWGHTKRIAALRQAQEYVTENDIRTNDQLVQKEREQILPEAVAKAQATLDDANRKAKKLIDDSKEQAARITF